MNGAVEAIVKLTKRRLKAFTQDLLFKEEALSTYLTEAEAGSNNRPLTSFSYDVTDLEPRTPYHFVISRGNPNFRLNTSNEADINLRKQWTSVQAATSVFWKQWVETKILEGLTGCNTIFVFAVFCKIGALESNTY